MQGAQITHETEGVNAPDLAALDIASQDAHEWLAFRNRTQSQIDKVLRAVSALPPLTGNAALDSLRHAYQVLYVADRIRKTAVQRRSAIPADLLVTAERILTSPNAKSRSAAARSRLEERYAVGARVSWHKLLKRLSPNDTRDGTIAEEQPSSVLREYIVDQLSDLLKLAQASELGNSAATKGSLAQPLIECLRALQSPPP